MGDLGSVSGLGKSPGEGNGYPLQYAGLENSMDYTVHVVTKSQTRLSNFHLFTSEYLRKVSQKPVTVRDFIFLGSKITVDGDYSLEIKRCLLLGRESMTILDSVLKNRDITLPTKIHIVKAMTFPVVIHVWM